MTKLDDEIRRALSAEDARLMEGLGADQALHRQLMETFQGKLAWLNIAGWVLGFALFAVFVFCAWNFTAAQDLRIMLQWGGASIVAFIGLAMVKMWFWMELHKNAVVREVKRLELQVARLGSRRMD